jgi:uncharacterized membrane protein
MIMKESERSLKIYFIVIGLFNIVFIAKDMIVNSSAFDIGAILSFVIGVLSLYYGVKMSKYIRTSPKTLVIFIYITSALTVISTFILKQWIGMGMMIFIAWYLPYSIKKISTQLKKADSSN